MKPFDYDETKPFGGLCDLPCEPTREQLIAHYRRCIDVSILEATKEEFRAEIQKLLQ